MWKFIEGFEGRYQVSDIGQVRSVDRPVRTKKGKVLKLQDTWDEYFTVGLYDSNGKYYIFSVHRLVASAFIPNPNNYPVVNHLDCDTHNNHVDNLEWTTVQGNTLHAVAMGRFRVDPIKIKKASDAAIRKTSKPVRCIETGEVFSSITACMKHVGHISNIYRYIARGEDIRGYHYEFVNPDDQQNALSKCHLYKLKGHSKHNAKPVRCIETGEVFESQAAASRSIGLPESYISGSAKHRHTNSRGISFEYVDSSEFLGN